tara:strand:+ start:2631 stop:2852 length:222 start_codon:yes stop_codon:yes gene_type:complete
MVVAEEEVAAEVVVKIEAEIEGITIEDKVEDVETTETETEVETTTTTETITTTTKVVVADAEVVELVEVVDVK